MENKSAHDLIMSIASETLEESGYHCNKKKCAVIINGEQEAGGGWATANYISHTKGVSSVYGVVHSIVMRSTLWCNHLMVCC